jgi:frataxin-like iron-binding protein CyaY
MYSLYFLTISPKNYLNLEEGLEEIRKNLNKWLRHNYIKERIKGGFFVIEAKEKEDETWNIHLHMVVYGRRLDNRIRGRCLKCNQNLLFYNKETKQYYCSNKNCNSTEVIVKENSKLNQLWIKSTGNEAHFHITSLKSASSTLNYMLKYISTNKEDFQSVKGEARYIMAIKGKRLVSSFGSFYKIKLPKLLGIPKICPHCNQPIEFIYNSMLVAELMQEKNPPPDNPSAWNEHPSIEILKII